MRGAAGEQAEAHDMVLLGGALAQGGKACVAGAAVAVDAAHEEDQQRSDQQEAQQAADQVKLEMHALIDIGQGQRLEEEGEEGGVAARQRGDDPAPARGQQDGADHDLQQEQEGEGVGAAAGLVQLPGQRRHIQHQRAQQLDIGKAPPPDAEHQRGQIDQRQQHQHRHHLEDGRWTCSTAA
jgi:hypothetical protein